MYPLLDLFGFFLGVALCFWRTRNVRRHFALCGAAVFMWSGLLLLDPQTHTPMFGIAAITSLVLALSQEYRREAGGTPLK